ncbi:hypothetical protein FQA39_LY05958 [Lamprigera yunnana]|nr:hypothetical protein FQA39_LY05958 [Lamprigera yunnana]
MAKVRHFKNPFEDYNLERAKQVISHDKLHPESKVVCTVESKWARMANKFQNLDPSDYSVYTGTAGIALLRFLKDPEDKTNLREIQQLLPLRKLKNKRLTFLCGDSGPIAIAAVIYHKLGRRVETVQTVDRCRRLLSLVDAVSDAKADVPNEYLYGRVGFLFSLLYVSKNIDSSFVPKERIREIIEAIIICGKNESRAGKFSCPLMYQWHDLFYLGAAHGVAGILYLLLQAQEHLTDTELNTLIKPTIDYLATLKYNSGNYPSSLGSENDKYVQWCHGAPGFLYLFSLASKVYNDPSYLELALKAGEVVWERGLVRKGYSLCHGVSGNAYCFLQLYQTTQDPKHLYRAIKFAEWCIVYSKEHEEYTPDRPLSLFEGIAGPMYLLIDIQKPMEAKFPGYTL